jgi:hypothetical protein
MSKKTTAKKVTKKTDAVEAKPAPEAKAAKEPKAKKEKAPREELCVFALRLREDERLKIHTTAGARNASQFARRVLVAFANEDVSAFKAVLDDAKTARQ